MRTETANERSSNDEVMVSSSASSRQARRTNERELSGPEYEA